MDVESPNDEANSYTDNKVDGPESNHVNGLNGYSSSDKHKSEKSEHKSKHRDKDRERDREKSKSSDHKSSSKDKDRHSSSSKDKDRHSSHKSSSKDKDRSDRGKDKDRSERSKDKDRSDRDKDKDRGDRDKDRGDRSDRDKDKHKEDRKSSSIREKEHKSSHDKDHKSSSKDKDRKDRDKSRHSSSKDKEKSRHSSSKDKEKYKDKEKSHSSSREKDKIKKEKFSEGESRLDDVDVENDDFAPDDNTKEDSVDEDDPKLVIKEESESQDEQDSVNVSQASSCDYNLSQFKDEPKFEEDEDIKPKPEPEEDSDEDIPLSSRVSTGKRNFESDEDDDTPLNARKKPKTEKKDKVKKKRKHFDDEEEEEDFKSTKNKKNKKTSNRKVKREQEVESPKKGGRKKKEEEQQEVWKWWEEEKKDDGTKWSFLEHKGPIFAPPYDPLPSNVKFMYDGAEMRLSEDTEEVAGFYAKMLDHDYTTKETFNTNFFKDWRKVMTEKERAKITDLNKCNFKYMHAYFMDLAEKNRNRTKEEKLALKEKNEALMKEYGMCSIDGHKEKIGNFKIEPPGLFRGRGEHPKMGKLKKRVESEHIIINCSKDAKVPDPPKGHKWKEVRHDPSVTWLASWTENVQNQVKYIMLNPSSKLKGEKDMQKYETARKLHKCIDKIRREYKDDWKSKEMRIRQRAVALYFIDKLALRAGNEKDEDQADTVGCCSLRYEHIELHEKKDDKEYVVVFDFLGKDSIRYYNEVPVEKRVFKNLQLFMDNKNSGDDLFDRLNTSIMNKHLNELMEGLTAKVFRTYNASFTLQQQLDLLTNEDDTLAEKILSYNRANRAVAILCNHQRAVPKGHQKNMEKLKEKIDAKRDAIKDANRQVKDAKKGAHHGSVKEKTVYDKKKKMLERLKDQLAKLEIQETDRDENKTISLGTSKLNYLDPRISVAWCKKYDVPIEKIYTKTHRDKFRWAIDMAGPDYRF